MFLLTQFIGLYVVDSFAQERIVDGQVVNILDSKILPYGMEMQEEAEPNISFSSILLSFVIAFLIIFLLTRMKARFVMRTWFLIVTILALGISFTAILPPFAYASLIAIVLAVPLAFLKIYGKNFLLHNFTELLIYPGIAAVFVPLLNLKTAIILLVIISIYDMWAVWKSGIMQKMAKFQMEELNVFSGFFLPYASKTQREKIKKLEKSGADLNKKKIKINVAILGGGDVIFPIITAGVVMKTWGVWPAFTVIFGALIGLGLLLFFSEKKKFYPAMPFISGGIFLALGLCWLIL